MQTETTILALQVLRSKRQSTTMYYQAQMVKHTGQPATPTQRATRDKYEVQLTWGKHPPNAAGVLEEIQGRANHKFPTEKAATAFMQRQVHVHTDEYDVITNIQPTPAPVQGVTPPYDPFNL